MKNNKKLAGGEIIGIGTDFLVIDKEGKRFLIEVNFDYSLRITNIINAKGYFF